MSFKYEGGEAEAKDANKEEKQDWAEMSNDEEEEQAPKEEEKVEEKPVPKKIILMRSSGASGDPSVGCCSPFPSKMPGFPFAPTAFDCPPITIPHLTIVRRRTFRLRARLVSCLLVNGKIF